MGETSPIRAGDGHNLTVGAGSLEMERHTQSQPHFKITCSLHVGGRAGSNIMKLHLERRSTQGRWRQRREPSKLENPGHEKRASEPADREHGGVLTLGGLG